MDRHVLEPPARPGRFRMLTGAFHHRDRREVPRLFESPPGRHVGHRFRSQQQEQLPIGLDQAFQRVRSDRRPVGDPPPLVRPRCRPSRHVCSHHREPLLRRRHDEARVFCHGSPAGDHEAPGPGASSARTVDRRDDVARRARGRRCHRGCRAAPAAHSPGRAYGPHPPARPVHISVTLRIHGLP